MGIERRCARCSASFTVKPHRLGEGARYCGQACYQAARRRRAAAPAEERFWAMVQRADMGCWLWLGPKRGDYGKARLDGREVSAHRAAWQRTFGAIPAGLLVLHLCDTKLCCRPSHL